MKSQASEELVNSLLGRKKFELEENLKVSNVYGAYRLSQTKDKCKIMTATCKTLLKY